MGEHLRKLSLLTLTVTGKKLDFTSTGCEYLGANQMCKPCEGVCENDDFCGGLSSCFLREDDEAVPGCEKGGHGDVAGYDYCAVLPRGIHFELLGCYDSKVGKSFGSESKSVDIVAKGDGQIYPIPQCKSICKESCYMGIETDENGKMKCICSNNADLSGKGVGLYECTNHEKAKVKCVDAADSVQFGCGGAQKVSVFVNRDRAATQCKSKPEWTLPVTEKKKVKSCTGSTIKYTVPPAASKIWQKVADPQKKIANLEAQCGSWCEMNKDCGCHVTKSNICYLMKWTDCVEVTGVSSTANMCNRNPSVFELTGCYSGSMNFVGKPFAGKPAIVTKTAVETCKNFCKDTCYMAVKKDKCFCFDSFESTQATAVVSTQCGSEPLDTGCSVVGGCGSQTKYSVYVNNLGGAKCVGGSPSSRRCDSSEGKKIGGYSYRILKAVKSTAKCSIICEKDSKCGCFSFAPVNPANKKGGCALKPKGMVCTQNSVDSKITAADKKKYGAGKCVQYVTTLIETSRKSDGYKSDGFDFQMVGCYPEEGNNKRLFSGDVFKVHGLEACKMLCRDKCYMGFHGTNECFCSNEPKWTGGRGGSAILENSCTTCTVSGGCDFNSCSVKYGCGGGVSTTKTKKMFSVYSNLAATSRCKVTGNYNPWVVKDMSLEKKSKTCSVVEAMDVEGDKIKEDGSVNSVEDCREKCESGPEAWRCQCFSYNTQTKKCKLMSATAGSTQTPCKWKTVAGANPSQTMSGKCDNSPVPWVLQGCYQDVTSGTRNLGKTFFHVNSKEACAKVCRFNCFMGIQGNSNDPKQCRCSDKPTWGSSKRHSCKATCNSGKGTCGDSYLDNIYANVELLDSPQCKGQTPKTPTSFVYIGCFQQKQTESLLKKRNFQAEAHDNDEMIFECFQKCKNFCFAAMQWLSYCTCGDYHEYAGKPNQMLLSPDKDCKRPAANRQDKDRDRVGACNEYGCGGAWRDSVYMNIARVKAGKCNLKYFGSEKFNDWVDKRFETFGA